MPKIALLMPAERSANSTVEGVIGFGRSVIEGAGQFFTGIGQVLNPSPLLKVFQGDFSGAWNDFRNNAFNGFKTSAADWSKQLFRQRLNVWSSVLMDW